MWKKKKNAQPSLKMSKSTGIAQADWNARRSPKCKGWVLWATMESVRKKKYLFENTNASRFKFFQKVGIETLKFLCDTINQIRKYLLSAYSLQGPMMSIEEEKSRIGHVPRELAHFMSQKFTLKNKQILCLKKKCLWTYLLVKSKAQ